MHDHLAAVDPRVCRLAATLAAGNLAGPGGRDVLDAPPSRTREQLQQQAYGDYQDRRATAVNDAWRAMNRRACREVDRERLAATFELEHLLICGACEIDTGKHLSVKPHPQYEAWGATGPGSRRLVCQPGGGLSVWP